MSNATVPKRVRIFIAHAKSDGDPFLEDVKVKIETTLRNAANARAQAVEPICVLGRDDHAAHFKQAGSWDAWCHDIVDRVDYATRDPVYNGIVVTNRLVGMATARIVQRALTAARPILLFCDDGILRPISEVRQVSSEASSGWEVVT